MCDMHMERQSRIVVMRRYISCMAESLGILQQLSRPQRPMDAHCPDTLLSTTLSLPSSALI